MPEQKPYAIIRTGSKQYRVQEGDVIDVELIPAPNGDTIEFGDVLFQTDGASSRIGQPNVAGCRVIGQLLGEVRGEKVIAYKYKRRKNYHRKIGHRQHYCRVKITGIEG
jgi:large subunit ribosomal protein L21